MKTTELTEHVRDALIRETTTPGAYVPLWKIADRISRYEPETAWPQLVPAVVDLEATGVVTIRTRGRISVQTTLRFDGFIVFDPFTGDRIIFATDLPGDVRPYEGERLFAARAIRLPTIPN